MFTIGESTGIILSLLAIFVAVIIPFIVEMMKRPELDIEIYPNQLTPVAPHRFLHGRVVNRPHNRIKWLDRNPAIDTRVKMTFYDRGRTRLFESVDAKWDVGPECITPLVQIHIHTQLNTVNVQNINTFDSTKLPFGVKANILQDNGGETFAFVVKHQGQNECYAFNGWSYQFPNWSNPNWMIGLGEFIIEVAATSGNSVMKKQYILRNNGPNLADISLAES